MKKYYSFIIFLILTSLVASLWSNFSQIYYRNEGSDPDFDKNELALSQESTLIFGVMSGPYQIDPHFAWDPYSMNIIEQACEGLFAYNYSDPCESIIPRLATDYGTWSPDGLNYTVPVGQNVRFHDGTPFNATAIEWNYNRFSYLANFTGTLPPFEYPSQLEVVYSWSDGMPIINRTEALDLYTIRYVLNRPYSALEALLCFSGSYILSPTSTDPMNEIDISTEEVVGTGPYVYENYIADTKVTFHAYENYWRTPAEIDSLIFSINYDSIELNDALINGDIDVLMNPLPSYLDVFNESATIDLIDDTKSSWTMYYIGMNNKQIDVKFREAISYAIDCDYIISTFRNGLAEKLKSPLPNGILYSNYTLNTPYLNITHAREVMKSMGYGVSFTTEQEWESATFATFNVTYLNVSSFYSSLADTVISNLTKIGIKIEDAGLDSWLEYISMLTDSPPYHKDMLQLYFLGWVPDYNDPSQIINVLFSNRTTINNFAQYNGGYGGFTPYDEDYDVQLLMEQALVITDKNERGNIYNKIQKLMIERDFPVAWLFTPKSYVAYNNDLEGFQEYTLSTVDDNNDASIKGDLIYLKWKSISGGAKPEIPGYPPIFISVIFVIYIYSILQKNYKKIRSS